MPERFPSPEVRPGKFDSARDEVLHSMTTQAWGTDSSGDVATPCGWFAKITNEAEDLVELIDAFSTEIVDAGLHDISLILGSYLVYEDDHGAVTVVQFPSTESLDQAYQLLEVEYQAWLEATDE